MKIIFLCVLSILYLKNYGQNIVIYDSINQKPVPFATILFEDSGMYANQYGKFQLPKNIQKDKEVHFTSLGYEKKNILVSALIDTIFLHPKTQILGEVVISSEKKILKIKRLGKSSPIDNHLLHARSEVISIIMPKGKMKNSYLHSVTFFFKNPTFGFSRYKEEFKNGHGYVFINLYEIKNGKPYKKIYSTPAQKIDIWGKDELEVDFSQENLKIGDKGFGFGIEYIGVYNKDGEKKDFGAIRPMLTDRESDFYTAKTYCKFPFVKNEPLIPYPCMEKASEYFQEERNLMMAFKVVAPN